MSGRGLDVGALQARVMAAFVDACVLDVTAFKPGNVGIHRAGHGMEPYHFVRSARAAAAAIAADGLGVGARVKGAIEATQAAVGMNTNLGIVLLAAPLATAVLDHRVDPSGAEFPEAVRGVLAASTVDDARQVFDAIVLANPGGLGDAAHHDVRSAARVTLLAAMEEARFRDMIAMQYANGFADVLAIGLGAFDEARTLSRTWPESGTWVYLTLLSRYPDSHVGRKLGQSRAAAVCEAAAGRLRAGCDAVLSGASRKDLLTWDHSLKTRGINPGTSADLTVATLFVARMRGILSEGDRPDR